MSIIKSCQEFIQSSVTRILDTIYNFIDSKRDFLESTFHNILVTSSNVIEFIVVFSYQNFNKYIVPMIGSGLEFTFRNFSKYIAPLIWAGLDFTFRNFGKYIAPLIWAGLDFTFRNFSKYIAPLIWAGLDFSFRNFSKYIVPLIWSSLDSTSRFFFKYIEPLIWSSLDFIVQVLSTHIPATINASVDFIHWLHDSIIRFKYNIYNYWPFVNYLSQEEKNERLWEAINNNDAAQLHVFIKSGANVNAMSNGMTPLMASAQNNHIALVKILIKAGASISQTILNYTFNQQRFEICKYLLDVMPQEQIKIEFEKESNSQELKTLIHTQEIKKLQAEIFRITPKNTAFSPFSNLPHEILTAIFSKNYRILTPEQVSKNIKFIFGIVNAIANKANPVPAIDEPLALEAGPQPVIFRSLEITTDANNKSEITEITETNDVVVDLSQDEDKKDDLKKGCGL